MNSLTPKTTLHGYFRSSAAYRVRIALNLKGIAYDNRTYHLRKGDQRTERYLAVNPQGLVPTLDTDGALLTQSLAIVEYLEEQWPTPPLLPSSSLDRARVRAMAQIIACDIHPIDNLRVLAYLRDRLAQPEPVVRDWYAHWVLEGLSSLEVLLSNDPQTGEFCHEDSPGLADLCLVPQVFNARNFAVDLSAFPTVVRIADAAAKLPAFEAAHPMNQPDAE